MPFKTYILTYQRRKGEAFSFPQPAMTLQQAAENNDSVVIHAENNADARKVAEEYFKFTFEQENPDSDIQLGGWRKAQVAVVEESTSTSLLPAPAQR